MRTRTGRKNTPRKVAPKRRLKRLVDTGKDVDAIVRAIRRSPLIWTEVLDDQQTLRRLISQLVCGERRRERERTGRPLGRPRVLNDRAVARMSRLRSSGHTQRQIAQKLGVAQTTVRREILREGLR